MELWKSPATVVGESSKEQADAHMRQAIAMVVASREPKMTHSRFLLGYILLDWLTQRMNELYVPHTMTIFKAVFISYHKPQLYCSEEVIDGRHYKMQLRKVPLVYLLEELTVTWQPELDVIQPPPYIPTVIAQDNDVSHPTGFYQVISHVSEDGQYLVKMKLTRV